LVGLGETIIDIMSPEYDVPRIRDIAIGALANAEVAAKKGDESKTIEHLKSTGKWAFVCRKNWNWRGSRCYKVFLGYLNRISSESPVCLYRFSRGQSIWQKLINQRREVRIFNQRQHRSAGKSPHRAGVPYHVGET